MVPSMIVLTLAQVDLSVSSSELSQLIFLSLKIPIERNFACLLHQFSY
jgi:hypothetical protein